MTSSKKRRGDRRGAGGYELGAYTLRNCRNWSWGFEAVFERYRRLLPWLKMAARHHGYNLLVHGSGTRDLDLVAVPWVQEASTAAELVEILRQAAGGIYGSERHPGRGYWKPHGRRAYIILLWVDRPDGQLMYLDISVLPTQTE